MKKEFETYYECLNVPRTASLRQIRLNWLKHFIAVFHLVSAFIAVCSYIFSSPTDNVMDSSQIPYSSTETYSVYKQDSKGNIKVYVHDLKSGKVLGWYYRDRIKKSHKTNSYRSVML